METFLPGQRLQLYGICPRKPAPFISPLGLVPPIQNVDGVVPMIVVTVELSEQIVRPIYKLHAVPACVPLCKTVILVWFMGIYMVETRRQHHHQLLIDWVSFHLFP